jgi:hypothetical protein
VVITGLPFPAAPPIRFCCKTLASLRSVCYRVPGTASHIWHLTQLVLHLSLQVSEGIDFSDKAGRGVVITGLPFPAAPHTRWLKSYCMAALRMLPRAGDGIVQSAYSTSSCLCMCRSPRALISVTGRGEVWSSQGCPSQLRTTPT